MNEKEKIMKIIKEFSKKLPKFPDGRIMLRKIYKKKKILKRILVELNWIINQSRV